MWGSPSPMPPEGLIRPLFFGRGGGWVIFRFQFPMKTAVAPQVTAPSSQHRSFESVAPVLQFLWSKKTTVIRWAVSNCIYVYNFPWSILPISSPSLLKLCHKSSWSSINHQHVQINYFVQNKNLSVSSPIDWQGQRIIPHVHTRWRLLFFQTFCSSHRLEATGKAMRFRSPGRWGSGFRLWTCSH